jgi:magnesium transporter
MIIKKTKYDFEFAYSFGVDDALESKLEEVYRIHESDIEDIFTDAQLSKMEVRSDYVYVAIQFPEFDKSSQKFLIKELHCFVSNNWLLVVDKHKYKHFQQFMNFEQQILEGEEDMSSFLMFAELLDFCMIKTYKAIARFKTEIAEIESDLFEFANDLDVLKDILIIKKNLVNFESVIEPLRDLIIELQTKYKKLKPIDLERLDNSLDTIKKTLNNLENFKEQMSLLSETNESLISRSTNNTVRTLTAVSLIGLVPTFWVGFFGMNVHFGFGEGNFVPLILVTALIAFSCGGLYYLFKKKGFI